MDSGRIEPLQALPVHQEAQLCLQHPVGQICTMHIDFLLKGIPQTEGQKPDFQAFSRGPSELAPSCGKAPGEALEAWRPWRPGPLPGDPGGVKKGN